jgi:2-polyprenyl-3-methyl-5-hydroxy-6-metoxy-1,4-benzoquinol methylase
MHLGGRLGAIYFGLAAIDAEQPRTLVLGKCLMLTGDTMLAYLVKRDPRVVAGTCELPPHSAKSRLLRSANSYACWVTTAIRALVRDRLYEAYASHHAGHVQSDAAALIYRRDIRPALPPPQAGPVIDIGCGQGELVRLLLIDGYDACGIDVSPEQVVLARAAGLDRVQEGDYREILAGRAGEIAVVTATDLLEHLDKGEVLETFDQVAAALVPGGAFVARVPNAASPFSGRIQYGDFTHESVFTARSVGQLAVAAGFSSVTVLACPPVVHGVISAARAALWKPISAMYKVALAAETGEIHAHIVTQNLTFVARKDG